MKFMRQATNFAVACSHFLCHSDKLAQCSHWYTQKKCGTCLLCLVVGFLSFPTGGPIFKPEIEQRVNYVFAFWEWRRLDRGAEIH